jgi:tRNA 2-selenouridine synthase
VKIWEQLQGTNFVLLRFSFHLFQCFFFFMTSSKFSVFYEFHYFFHQFSLSTSDFGIFAKNIKTLEKRITIEQFLADNDTEYIVLDARTPAEYAQGHIVGALNLPLFTDEERVVVGTAYKKQSPEKALLKGLDFVGKKMSVYIKRAQKMSRSKKVTLYCWRGGKRSGSLAWLLDLAGFEVQVIEGGYKKYRNAALSFFENQPMNFVVIGGKTGSGKTKILHQLQLQGAQILDLEGLANHKGSSFGALGELPQPSSEHYEACIFEALRHLDFTEPIYIENESRMVGTCAVPLAIWDKYRSSKLISVEIPHQDRLENLVVDYAQYDAESLVAAFQRIEKKLGGMNFQKAVKAIEDKKFDVAADFALGFYDKTYTFGLENNKFSSTTKMVFDHANFDKIATEILNFKD